MREAFRLYRVPIEQTHAFRDLSHDADLLPQVRNQLDNLLRCIPADQHIEYDVQGLRDQGTDVVVRLAADGRESYICFQVKSHKEIADSDLVAKLRTQHSESVDHYGSEALWCILLAVDVSTRNNIINSRLRGIRQAFAKKARTVVIDPTNLGGFFRLTRTQMTSLVTLTLRAGDDPIIADARADVGRHPLRSAVLLELVARSIAEHHRSPTIHSLAGSAWLQAVSAQTPWDPAYDGPALADPPPGDDSPEDFPSPSQQDPAPAVDWSEVDIWTPPRSVLGRVLRPQLLESVQPAFDRLVCRLPNALDALVASDDLEMRMDGTIVVEPGAHPALFSLASEAAVRYVSSAEDLREYLVGVLFPDAPAN